MAEGIIVVGLAGRDDLAKVAESLAGRTVLARTESWLPNGSPPGWTVANAYDDWFESVSLAELAEAIAGDLAERARTGSIAYLVPGMGSLGDETIVELVKRCQVTVLPGAPNVPATGHAQIVDALTLAIAEESAPFEAGRPALDATRPVIVMNWHGRRATALAARRLRKIYGVDELPASDSSGTLTLPGRDPLDTPPSFAALAQIVARLRRPDGCPWDREQDHASLLAAFASEVDEFAEAVDAEDWKHAAEELGDILLNVLMQTQIGAEAGHFAIEDVLAGVNAKLVRRHPHVFAGVAASSPDEVLAVWKQVKREERDDQRKR